MSFWDFANNHEIVTLIGVLGIGSCVASCVKNLSRGFGWNGKGKTSGKIETKTPRTAASSPEKAH